MLTLSSTFTIKCTYQTYIFMHKYIIMNTHIEIKAYVSGLRRHMYVYGIDTCAVLFKF